MKPMKGQGLFKWHFDGICVPYLTFREFHFSTLIKFHLVFILMLTFAPGLKTSAYNDRHCWCKYGNPILESMHLKQIIEKKMSLCLHIN